MANCPNTRTLPTNIHHALAIETGLSHTAFESSFDSFKLDIERACHDPPTLCEVQQGWNIQERQCRSFQRCFLAKRNCLRQAWELWENFLTVCVDEEECLVFSVSLDQSVSTIDYVFSVSLLLSPSSKESEVFIVFVRNCCAFPQPQPSTWTTGHFEIRATTWLPTPRVLSLTKPFSSKTPLTFRNALAFLGNLQPHLFLWSPPVLQLHRP